MSSFYFEGNNLLFWPTVFIEQKLSYYLFWFRLELWVCCWAEFVLRHCRFRWRPRGSCCPSPLKARGTFCSPENQTRIRFLVALLRCLRVKSCYSFVILFVHLKIKQDVKRFLDVFNMNWKSSKIMIPFRCFKLFSSSKILIFFTYKPNNNYISFDMFKVVDNSWYFCQLKMKRDVDVQGLQIQWFLRCFKDVVKIPSNSYLTYFAKTKKKSIFLFLLWTLFAILSLSSIDWRGFFLTAFPPVLMVGLPRLFSVPWGSRLKSIIWKYASHPICNMQVIRSYVFLVFMRMWYSICLFTCWINIFSKIVLK